MSKKMRELQGWLIINEFISTVKQTQEINQRLRGGTVDKFSELTHWFLIAAGKYGVRLNVYTNAEILAGAGRMEDRNSSESGFETSKNPKLPDFVLFWDKDVKLAEYLERKGLRVFNSASSIACCDDKRQTYLTLMNCGIPMPKTIIAPFTYDNIGYNRLEFLAGVEKELSFPLVLKEAFGSFGMQVYLIQNHEELEAKVLELSPKPLLFQEFMGEYAGTDVRLQVVGDRVVASMFRYSENGDFRANLTRGGKMMNYVPTEKQCKIALAAVKELGLSFGGVDLIFGHDEEPVLCEVNSNAHFRNIFDCTGVNVADEIIAYIMEQFSGKFNC